VTLSNPSLTVPLLTSLVPNEKLLAYQFAFDLVEGGAQDFLESVRNELPEGDDVSLFFTFFPLVCLYSPYWYIKKTKDMYDKLRNILGGQESVKLYLEFLKRNNKVDLLILKNTKVSISKSFIQKK